MRLLEKQLSVKYLLAIVALLSLVVALAGCFDNQTSASNQNATTAAQKWGDSPNISNYYEYLQLKAIYEARDNPQLVLNAYLYSEQTGQLTCLGKVKGFGVPYGTEWSPPSSGTQDAVPEPNGLYPSQNTNADWLQLIGPDGKTHISFVEPNLIITDQNLPCKPLAA